MSFKKHAFEVLETLKEELPLCFRRGNGKLPLAVGIHEAVIKHYVDDNRFSKNALKKAIAIYVKGSKYLANVAVGVPRIDMNGKPVSTVTQKDQDYAAQILNTREKLTESEERVA